MAYIDKIYGSFDNWLELIEFLIREKPSYLRYTRRSPPKEGNDHPLSNFPEHADKWLIRNCRLEFVLNRLKEQYPNWKDIMEIEKENQILQIVHSNLIAATHRMMKADLSIKEFKFCKDMINACIDYIGDEWE